MAIRPKINPMNLVKNMAKGIPWHYFIPIAEALASAAIVATIITTAMIVYRLRQEP